MWMVFRICERIVFKIESLLKDTIKDEREVKELSRVFSIPLKSNDVTNERMDLLKIALKKNKLTNSELKNILEEHTQKYQHIPLFDFDHDPYTLDHFARELKLIEKPREELEKTELTFKERTHEFETMLRKLNPKPELKNLIYMLKEAVFLRDYRDMIRQKLNLTLRDFYQEIGLRIGLTVKEVALLTNKEIENHLLNSLQFDKAEIESRKKSFLLVQVNDQITLYSGEEAHTQAKKLKLYPTLEKIDLIKGRSASPGKIKGIAKIVHTNLDLAKVKKGDVLVAAMTRQDFVPVMRRASAIVTDEGGVTCHAAIIARELGLPCVVGTKVATQVLKDGDLIEVNGEEGTVRKVKKHSRK